MLEFLKTIHYGEEINVNLIAVYKLKSKEIPQKPTAE